MLLEYYPPRGFYFTVTVIPTGKELSLLAASIALLSGIDASFQEVSGIQAELVTDDVVEGGENRFAHRLPRYGKYPNLVLKRGIVTFGSFLAEWAGQTIGSKLSLPIITQDLLVALLNENGLPLVAWAFVNAYPIRWDIAALNSTENKVLIETLELSYNYFNRFNLGAVAFAASQLSR